MRTGFTLQKNTQSDRFCCWCMRELEMNEIVLIGFGIYIQNVTREKFIHIDQLQGGRWCLTCANFVLDKYTNEEHEVNFKNADLKDEHIIEFLRNMTYDAPIIETFAIMSKGFVNKQN